MRITRSRLHSTLKILREVGYPALCEEDKRICDAFDECTLDITETPPDRSANPKPDTSRAKSQKYMVFSRKTPNTPPRFYS